MASLDQLEDESLWRIARQRRSEADMLRWQAAQFQEDRQPLAAYIVNWYGLYSRPFPFSLIGARRNSLLQTISVWVARCWR